MIATRCLFRTLLVIAWLAMLFVAHWPALVQAQDGDEITVLVTTQDYSSLRNGPSIYFQRLTIIDPAVTMTAIGRTADTGWIQVNYQGQLGWIHAGLLVWNGDIISLPVDGVSPMPFVRRVGVAGVTTRETPLYERELTAADLVGILPEGTIVEVTGRLGGSGMYQLQILYEDQLYWVGSWNIRITEGNDLRVLDTSYLFPYGRLLTQFESDISGTTRRLRTIEEIWLRLNEGSRVNCANVPGYASLSTSAADLAQEPVFAPLVVALETSVEHTNRAISAFDDACSRATTEGFFLTQQDVNAALDDIDTARQNLNVARSLLASLDIRNPILSGGR